MIRLPILIAAVSIAFLPLAEVSAADCYPRAVKDGAKVIGTIEGPFAFELWLYEGELLIQIPFEPKGDDYVPTGFTVTPFDLSQFVGEYEIVTGRGKQLKSGNANGLSKLEFSTYDLQQYAGDRVRVSLEEDGTVTKVRFQVPSSYKYAVQQAQLTDALFAFRGSGAELCPAKGSPG